MKPDLMKLLEEIRDKLDEIIKHPETKSLSEYIDLIKDKTKTLEVYIEEELQDENNLDTEEEGN